ncbi:MAG: SIMPL domain-containing protein [Bacteroidia bacterium]|jgi:hypothetical protein|nr:SIMPL domain-containing protein [Bacteroidia bacterium]
MKTTLLLLSIFLLPTGLLAQTTANNQSKLHVTGSATMEILPDEIYVDVELKEFTREKKKTTIEELESGLVKFLENQVKIPKANIKMDNTDEAVIALRRLDRDAVITKKYEVKFSSFTQVNQLLAVMDSLNIRSASVSRLWHSKMDEYKKQLRINAMKAANEKAIYMLESIGAKKGKPLFVDEGKGEIIIEQRFMQGKGKSDSVSSEKLGSDGYKVDKQLLDTKDPLSARTMTLSYSVDVTYEIL